MQAMPQPKPGLISAITIGSADLDASVAFYQKLGFRELWRADWPFPWVQVTDDQLLIMLRKDLKPYIAMTYYVTDIEAMVADLQAKGILFSQKPKPTDEVKRYLFQSPDGMNISLVGIVEGFFQPVGPTMLTMNPADYMNAEKYTNKTVGLFGEFAHPVKNLQDSIAFWEKIGFTAISKFTSPYPWAILSDGLHVVGAHQTESFTQKIMTFLAVDSKDKIEKLKAAGLQPVSESGPASAVFGSPEGQKVNVFKLGM